MSAESFAAAAAAARVADNYSELSKASALTEMT
jgi:hypothetical protein